MYCCYVLSYVIECIAVMYCLMSWNVLSYVIECIAVMHYVTLYNVFLLCSKMYFCNVFHRVIECIVAIYCIMLLRIGHDSVTQSVYVQLEGVGSCHDEAAGQKGQHYTCHRQSGHHHQV